MKRLAAFIVNSISPCVLGIWRMVALRFRLAPGDNTQQSQQHPMPALYVQYRRYIQVTAEWLDGYWLVINRWARTFLDSFLPYEVDVEGPQLGPMNRSPNPISATAVSRPPAPTHHED